MTNTQRTPGPWLVTTNAHSFTIGPDDGFHGIIVARDQFGGYEEKDGWRRERREPLPNAEADARLIAAAPDLLRALQDLSSLYDAIWVQMSNGEMDLVSAAWEQADAAIAKATSAKTIEFPATAFEGGPK